MYNPASTSIEAKASHGWRGNLPFTGVHQRPYSSVKITEDSNGANTGKTSEVEADHEEVEEEYIPAPIAPIKKIRCHLPCVSLKISISQGSLRVEYSKVKITVSEVCLFLFIQ